MSEDYDTSVLLYSNEQLEAPDSFTWQTIAPRDEPGGLKSEDYKEYFDTMKQDSTLVETAILRKISSSKLKSTKQFEALE